MYNNEMIIVLPMGASVSETLYSDVLYLAVMLYNNEMILLLPMGASVSEILYSDVLYFAVMLYLAVNLFKRIIRAILSFLNNSFLLGS